MSKVDILEVKKTILEDNDADAEVLRGELKEQKLCYLNLMSSPGSGKTTTLLSLLKAIDHRIEVGVMEADIDSDVDAKTIADAGYKSIQLHTGGMCHLDAEMSRQGMRGLGCDDLDLVILENVGNLVCPAEFDTGAVLNVVILSITEGDDKPLKYPLVFEQCDAVIINKIDALPVFDFDFDKARANIALRNDHATVFPISAKTTEGVDKLADWIVEKVQEWQGK
ncbi:hydrogenase nickel incorporation protein HypB [Lachnospiraceae bacterium A10]|nr:hydrogenase nickel incorporation protein HypB [Lachnospiraceae bacterium A10]